MTTNSTRLSATQLSMLTRLAAAPRGENVPGGARNSGRDASAWYRTLAVLVRLNLATRHSQGAGSGWALATERGRRLVAGVCLNCGLSSELHIPRGGFCLPGVAS